jgi:hypothetical protein
VIIKKTNTPNIIAGAISFSKLIPDALKAVISLSEDNLPKLIKTAIRTAIGIAKEIIHAEL